MTSPSQEKAASAELTGGAGFTYEDTVAARYLVSLLRRERSAGQDGAVIGVAVQQNGNGNAMDDLVVDCDEAGSKKSLSLQIKRSLTISAGNAEFQDIIRAAVATQAQQGFRRNADRAGFVVEHVANESFRSLTRLIEWAKASPNAQDFDTRFQTGGAASEPTKALRTGLLPIIGATSTEAEIEFYRHFTALELNGLAEGAADRTEYLNRLRELVVSPDSGDDALLFDSLCRMVREGEGVAARWDRTSLLQKLRGKIRLRIAPNFAPDIERLHDYSIAALNDVSETIDGFHVERSNLQHEVRQKLKVFKLISISGLPGCGKSAVLKHLAAEDSKQGPILFLKSDRIEAAGWITFATSLGLQNTRPNDLLAEIGSAGTPVLYIDGIDRVRPDRRGVILDLLSAIEADPALSHWKVIATSRDQGLETYSAWFPSSFYKDTGIGDVQVLAFSDEEAELLAASKPNLRKVLFGNEAVQQIARRPFFAAVLARTIPATTEPQTEVDLINAWWKRAGHHSDADNIPQRQRALLDIAEKGARNLGKSVAVRELSDATHAQLHVLREDYIIREERGGANVAFTHDIFFEWSFFRLLIDLGDAWTTGLELAGEAPLLGRVIGLLAQDALSRPGAWTKGYAALSASSLRPQWRREWLTAPPFTNAFAAALDEFRALLMADDWTLFDKLLVWFQAQHTIPSPMILARPPTDGIDNVRVADLLGWPSDGAAWGKLIDWLLSIADEIPVRSISKVLDVFGVWQNIASDIKNRRSAVILKQTDAWLRHWEAGTLSGQEGDRPARHWRNDWQSPLASTLRQLVLVSARSYPDYAKALFQRALADENMRRGIFSELMAFAPFMAQVAPELLAEVAEAEILEELPKDKLDREKREREEAYQAREAARAIPENQRTEQQKRMLSPPMFIPSGRDRIDFDDIGIERHNNFFFPESPIHEPFASLFSHKPEVALKLVRTLSNHATKGWLQLHAIRPKQEGTPLPVSVIFPWGEQRFWGDWRVYSWGNGQLAPNPLDCAFLALRYWAFKQIEAGKPASEIIQKIVEGNECYAVLGIALTLVIETRETNETTLAVVTCQRLWHHDTPRVAHESTRNIDIFGIGPPKLTSHQRQAQDYLDSRKSRKHDIRQLAIFFALSPDETIRQKFQAALEKFPSDLPYELEEQRSNEAATEHLKAEAERWAGLGNKENYRNAPAPEGQVAIYYESPKPFTLEQQQRLEESTATLTGYSINSWATGYLQSEKPDAGMTLADAVKYARDTDNATMFDVLREGGNGPEQSAIASVAACVIRFADSSHADWPWAWEIMGRIEKMQEAERDYRGARMAWHPATRLAVALQVDRRSDSPQNNSAERLFRLALHPMETVSETAFVALFLDRDPRVQWIAGQLAFELCVLYRDVFKDGEWQRGDSEAWEKKCLANALSRLQGGLDEPMLDLPPAWVKGNKGGRRRVSEEEWQYPEPSFAPSLGKMLFSRMPIEVWLSSATYRPMFETFVIELVRWTSESILPPWRDKSKRHDKRTDLFEWQRDVGHILARTAPFMSLEDARDKLVSPFLADDEEALGIIAAFVDMTTRRHVMDPKTIPANTMPLLRVCVERVASDRTFVPGNYRAGEIYGHSLPEILRSLFFVSVDGNFSGSSRFANGDWSEISTIMPIIDDLVTRCGWVPFVIQTFLTLCERVGVKYPVADFARQVNAALSLVEHAEGKWSGTTTPARIAGMIQRLADHNFPLKQEDALELLKALDALIDLGDRRSAALEQTEAFKGVQAKKAS